LTTLLKRLRLQVEMLKLGVTVGMAGPFACFAVALQTVPHSMQ
jgi:hypothetical protein